jgi:small subunit ribosomal protein S6
MNKFEAVILLNPDISTSIIAKEDENFLSNIAKSDGKIINHEDWGLKELSYNIKNHKKAFYKFYQIEINGKKLEEIKKNLTQNEKIMRHLFIKVDAHQELPTKLNKNEEK